MLEVRSPRRHGADGAVSANRRSLGQQALHDLEQLAEGDAIECRKQAFARLHALWNGKSPVALTPSPEEMIRSDRER